ncbi:S41 family peptidase [Yoonia sp.]|uniref:S41 family peptidase n=1 Tax=Yoonia sp. TaxID=2212373 RepID=UPI0025EAE6B3|nr:S41 family peptidase [Yoonia sp.]
MALLRWALALSVVGFGAFGVSWAMNMPGHDIRGTWATDGYGLQIDIGRAAIDVYEVTAISCYHTRRIPAHQWLIAGLTDIHLTRDGPRLRIDAGGSVSPIMADRTTTLPAHCPTTPDQPGTARDNFDVLWQAMQEHYAFFDLHGVDWFARRDSLRPLAQTVLDDDALLALFKTMLAGLDDGHLSLRTTNGLIYSPSVRPSWHADRHMVRDNTLAQFSQLTAVADTGLLYGWATPEIGYVYMSHMDTNAGFNIKGADRARSAFAEIALAFAAAKGVILDVRYNPGGSDEVALAYAGYFTDIPHPAFTKATRNGGGYTPPDAVALAPNGTFHIKQPTAVLISGFSGSAAEVFVMSTRQLPQVTVIGTNTSGILSNIASFSLPNGWALGLSHQRYVSPDGVSLDGVGIPPDIEVAVAVDAARNGMDETLQQAIKYLSDK